MLQGFLLNEDISDYMEQFLDGYAILADEEINTGNYKILGGY